MMKEDVRRIIVNASRSIFARFGFNKTTMNEIARAVRKAKSSIYHYFDSKEEIFREVVKKETEMLKEEILKAVNKKNNPKEQLSAYIVTKMQTLHHLANYYSALKDEYLDHYIFVEKLRKKHFKDEIDMVKKILEEGLKKDIFTIKDLDLTSFAIVTALKGVEYPWPAEKSFLKTKKNIDSLIEILFNGIVKR